MITGNIFHKATAKKYTEATNMSSSHTADHIKINETTLTANSPRLFNICYSLNNKNAGGGILVAHLVSRMPLILETWIPIPGLTQVTPMHEREGKRDYQL